MCNFVRSFGLVQVKLPCPDVSLPPNPPPTSLTRAYQPGSGSVRPPVFGLVVTCLEGHAARRGAFPSGGPAGEGSQAAKGSVEVFAALGWLALFSHRSLK